MNINMDASSLLWGLLFGSIGMGYFIYGKKKGHMAPILSGIGLMVYTFFVTNSILIVLIGIVLMAVPYFLRYI